MRAMAGISMGPFQALAEKFDFSRYKTLCDVGGATGQLSIIVASRHPHLQLHQRSTCRSWSRSRSARSRRPG